MYGFDSSLRRVHCVFKIYAKTLGSKGESAGKAKGDTLMLKRLISIGFLLRLEHLAVFSAKILLRLKKPVSHK